MFSSKDQLAMNTLRALSMNQVEAANSGHPGLPLGAAPMAYALWAEHLRVDPANSQWMNRDRFILSAGHGSALLYSLLHMAGFDVTIDDLKQFRKMDSRTPGHPEYGFTDGVEATSGPLGQGFAQAVGMAMAEAHLAAQYNRPGHDIIDHYTYTLVGDGDLMEGISYEAASYAGKMKLGKLIVLYDSNDISLDGDLHMSFVEDIKGRFEAQNWHYLRVDEGMDIQAVSDAIEEAKKVTDKPTMIEIKTVIGFGSPDAGTHKVHGAPIGQEGWDAVRKAIEWTHEDFEVPQEAKDQFKERVFDRGQKAHEEWKKAFEAYEKDHPELAKELKAAFNGELPEDYAKGLELVDTDTDAEASRISSSRAIQALGQNIPYFWGGSADLSSSNKTMNEQDSDFMPDNYAGRNIWYGVREFAMAAMMNGIALHGGTRTYAGTFFVFTDYLKAAVRLSALSKLPVTYVMTHDSIAVGEDGPTHEPIEQLAGFRATPNLNTIRPADLNETFVAWQLAVESTDRPTMLVLTRQDLPVLEGTKDLAQEGVRKGAYVLSPAKGEKPEGILIATGSEVALALEVQEALKGEGVDVSVVSMPCQNLFDEQDAEYKESVLPSDVRNRMSIEMGATFGWERYIGLEGVTIGLDRFGASGNANDIIPALGFNTKDITKRYLDAFSK